MHAYYSSRSPIWVSTRSERVNTNTLFSLLLLPGLVDPWRLLATNTLDSTPDAAHRCAWTHCCTSALPPHKTAFSTPNRSKWSATSCTHSCDEIATKATSPEDKNPTAEKAARVRQTGQSTALGRHRWPVLDAIVCATLWPWRTRGGPSIALTTRMPVRISIACESTRRIRLRPRATHGCITRAHTSVPVGMGYFLAALNGRTIFESVTVNPNGEIKLDCIPLHTTNTCRETTPSLEGKVPRVVRRETQSSRGQPCALNSSAASALSASLGVSLGSFQVGKCSLWICGFAIKLILQSLRGAVMARARNRLPRRNVQMFMLAIPVGTTCQSPAFRREILRTSLMMQTHAVIPSAGSVAPHPDPS